MTIVITLAGILPTVRKFLQEAIKPRISLEDIKALIEENNVRLGEMFVKREAL